MVLLVLLFSLILTGVVLYYRRAVERTEKKYRTLASNNPFIFWTTDRTGKTTFVSSNLFVVCGIYPEELYERGQRLWLERVHTDDFDSVQHSYASLIKTGDNIELEYRFEKAAGEWIWLQEKGGLERVLSDITQRKHAEQSADQLTAIVASSDEAIVGVSPAGVIYNWNRGAERVFGYASQEMMGRSLWTVLPHEHREKFLQAFERVAQNGHGQQFNSQWVRKDGSPIDVSLMISPIQDKVGNITGISTIARDISDQKRAEETIAESKRELKEYIDHMSTMSAKIALDGTILFVNNVAELASGMPREQLFKTNFLQGPWWSFDPRVQQRVVENFAKAAAGQRIDCEEKLFFAGVQVIDINFSLTPVFHQNGRVNFILAEGRDISMLKKTEQALVKAQQIAKLGSWEWNLANGKVRWSESLAPLLGLDIRENEMDYRSLLGMLPPEVSKDLQGALEDCIKTGGNFSFDRRIRWMEGPSRWVHVQGELFFDDVKKPLRMEGTVQDITERKKTEDQRLQLAQERDKRKNAEQDHQRANFLAQASLLLSSSLDYEETLLRLARLLTVSLADWCVLYLTEGKGKIARTIVAHPDKTMEEKIGRLFREAQATGLKNHPVLAVVSSEKSVVLAQGPESLHDAYKGSQSIMIVPLVVRGQALGAIEFVAWESGRRYEQEDLVMAEEISHYAGVAIENARLYTDMKRSEAAERALAAIVESSDDAIIGKNLDGNITSWNKGAEKLYGYKAAEVMGHSMSLLIPPDRPDEMADILRRIKNGQNIERFETVRLKKDGTPFHVSLTISVIKDAMGRLVGASTIARDITERKRYEEGLAQARDAAIMSDQTKSEFVANVSHEIRTPMNGIVGMTTLLQDTKLAPKQRDFVETIRSSCDTLLAIVNDILDFSKIEAGKMSLEIQDFDLAQMLESTVEFLAPRAHFKGLELISILAHDVPEGLRGDPARLRQVLTNFIGNAIKFTDKGEVIVRATKDSENDTHVTLQLSVSDTGIGIPLERQGNLFQPFNQVDPSSSRKFGGTGLGLAISKRFVELMGGDIGVKSSAGQGSTFWCLVTFEKQTNPMESTSERTEGLSNIRVLVVDENPAHREALVHCLSAWKTCSTECAAESADAIEILTQEAAHGNPYQVVIINQQAGGEAALSLSRQIKNRPNMSVGKVIVLTMVNQPIDIEAMEEAGVSECLSKPVKPSALFESLSPAMAKTPARSARPKRLAEAKSRSHRSHVLVVEDNGVNQKVMLQQLENLGYKADAVGNGLEAVQALEHVPYDLILMDCQMPEMDGYAATKVIRKREGSRAHTPIIAMTAHVMTGDREKCLAAGMDDYIPKPIKTENLKATLARWEGKAASSVADSPTNPLNDPKFVREVSRLFLKETPKYLQAMKQALNKKDPKALSTAAHTLAGSCCIVGTKEIKALCRRLETKSTDRKLSGVGKILTELSQEFEVVQKMLDVKRRRDHHENSYRR